MSVEEDLTRALVCWGVGSVVTGAALSAHARTRGFGRQTAAWGAVDTVIAYAGIRGRRTRGLTDGRHLRRVLLVNSALDVGYVAGGAWLVRDGRWRGDGLAVALQGVFLLWLDARAAWRLGRVLP